MNILFLTRYSFDGPSSRYRVYQFKDSLKKRGFNVKIVPLIGQSLFERDYLYRSIDLIGVLRLTRSAIKRIKNILIDCKKFDMVFVQKDLFITKRPLLEKVLSKQAKRIIVDIDDYFLYRTSGGRKGLNKSFLYLLNKSDAIIAGSKYLKEACMAFNDNVFLLPTVIDTHRFVPKQYGEKENKEYVDIGWIGSPTTGEHLEMIKDVFQYLDTNGACRLKVCGLRKADIQGIEILLSEWSYETEIDFLSGIDIGIMPLPDSEFAKGKCGLKLLQYMAMGKPVVASPVGANLDIVVHGENGYLANTEGEWAYYLERLIENKDLRKQMGEKGRRIVEEHYSLQMKEQLLAQILIEVGSQ